MPLQGTEKHSLALMWTNSLIGETSLCAAIIKFKLVKNLLSLAYTVTATNYSQY